MDDPLRELTEHKLLTKEDAVLILVVMDDPLRVYLTKEDDNVIFRLNPCCNGWSSKRSREVSHSDWVAEVLILVVMDDPLRGVYDLGKVIEKWPVLILVVMDDPLRGIMAAAKKAIQVS